MLLNKRSRKLHSVKQIQKQKKKLIITVLVFSFSIIFFLLLIILLLNLSFLQVSSIKIENTKSLNINDIENKVKDLMKGYYLGIIPKTNIFLYPKSIIKEYVLNDYNKIDFVDFKISNFSILNMYITEKMPVAVICDEPNDDENLLNKCYFSDKNAYVFEIAPDFSSGVYNRYYNINNDNKERLGKYFIDTNLFREFQNMLYIIRENRIIVTGVLIGENDQYEMYIKNKDLSTAIVYFDNKSPFEKIAENLIVFWNDNISKNLNATNTINFDYINLRFGNNIFYVTK